MTSECIQYVSARRKRERRGVCGHVGGTGRAGREEIQMTGDEAEVETGRSGANWEKK